MTREQRRSAYPSAVISILVVLAIVVPLRVMHRDVRFCRTVLRDLASGRQSVQSRIQWERLTAMGVNVGATYTALPNNQERTEYRRAFVKGFANGFAKTGARPEAFTNWRAQGREGGRRVVAAEYPAKHKTLLFRISSAWSQRLEAVRWQ